jgi:hypothetical protein
MGMWRLGDKAAAPAGAPTVMVQPGEGLRVRPRLTRGEVVALAVALGACVLAMGYEFGWRRPMQQAASAAAAAKPQAWQTTAAAARPGVAPDAPQRPAVPPAAAGATAGTARASDEIVEIEVVAPNDRLVPPIAGRDDPFRKPGTLYRCRRYDGSVFWTDLHCSQHRGALIERIAKVPPDLPFDQQVRFARDDAKRFESSLAAEQAELQRINTCASLIGERAQILRRAGDATVLNAVLAADRNRAREIDSTLQRLRCGG